ncbi:MAG: histidine ammonia-lyase [Betaproteobacteria bacterium]
MSPLTLTPAALTFASLRKIWSDGSPLVVDPGSRGAVDASAATVARVLASGQTVYGVNTGFGLLARTRIDDARLTELQRALVRSHSAGTGPLLDDATVRLIMALKATSLACGYSGVRWEVIDLIVRVANAGIVPCIPGQGSVGASGDLAPLAHVASVLIGEGEARVDGRVLSGAAALAAAGLAPIELMPKEGLALLNGTQVSTALALSGLFAAERALAAGFVAGAMTVDACLGSDTPFDARIQAVRGHRGQIDAARVYRDLLAGSSIRASHVDCHRVQDPYSLRCQPQVMGACLDQMRHAASVLLIEANAVSDNPLVFAESGEILSGGNFHAEPVAFAADNLALAIAEIGALSERRTALLMDSNMSGLPPFLIEDGGVNSGFMIAQVTAAALASENKSLAHPSSVDSLPTSANQEDHVSMATNAARRLLPMAGNTAAIVAIELLAAAQGLDLRRPLTTSPVLARAHALIRESAAYWACDRAFAPDLSAIRARVEAGEFAGFADAAINSQ